MMVVVGEYGFCMKYLLYRMKVILTQVGPSSKMQIVYIYIASIIY